MRADTRDNDSTGATRVVGAARVKDVFDEASGYRCLQIEPAPLRDDVVIVFLHGVGERGGEIDRVLDYGLPATLRDGSHGIDCRVLCPHLPAEAEWDAPHLERLLESVRRRAAKVVVCGYSLGGAGACALLARRGDLADATIVIAARYPWPIDDVAVANPVVFVEGELDDWVDTGTLRASIARHGTTVEHVVLHGAGHFIAEAAMDVPAVRTIFETLGVRYAPLGRG
jgi:predicted esterase